MKKQALQIIARAAEGGMRDALSLLDQAISYSDETGYGRRCFNCHRICFTGDFLRTWQKLLYEKM